MTLTIGQCVFAPTAEEAELIAAELQAAAQREADSLDPDEDRIDLLADLAEQWRTYAQEVQR